MNINLLNTTELAALQNIVAAANSVVIFSHINADGDALGSSLTWAEYLRQQGKTVTVVMPDQYPDFLHWLPGQQSIMRNDKKMDEVDKAINAADMFCICDLNTLSRLGATLQARIEARLSATEGATPPPSLLLIDHHLNPDIPATMQVSFPELSSTSEIVFRLLWQLEAYEAMTKEMAITTYCGMMTDTGGFTFNSTRPEIFFIISKLLEKGIDKDKIYRNVFNVFSIDRLRLTGYVMYQKLKVLSPLRASYYTISREDQRRFHYIKGDAEGLVNMPLQIKGHRLSISLREDSEKDNIVWVSLRSVDDFPCNEMAAQFFNGGGHKNASGGRLYCSLSEAEQTARKAIQAFKHLL